MYSPSVSCVHSRLMFTIDFLCSTVCFLYSAIIEPESELVKAPIKPMEHKIHSCTYLLEHCR